MSEMSDVSDLSQISKDHLCPLEDLFLDDVYVSAVDIEDFSHRY